jgi:sigma-E factor negative regulatory protein RseB
MRHGLLLTAVATVTVPGLLAMLAVVGHEHVEADAGAAAVALEGAPLSAQLPVALTTVPAAGHEDVAGVQSAPSSTAMPALSGVSTGQQAKGVPIGIRLLTLAADASLTTSYQGTEAVSQSGVAGSVEMTSQVWHQGGGTTLVETLNNVTNDVTSATPRPTLAPAAGVEVASSDPASGSPEGVFGVTTDLVKLLRQHYFALDWGTGSVVGRPATVVALYRSDNSLAARYWLDNQTMVPLRRELYDTSGHVISDDSFIDIQFGAITLPQLAATGAAPAEQAQPAQSWVAAASPAQFLTSLTGQGWQVPAAPPGGLPLYAAASTTTASGKVVDLEYSDGLYDISVFMQRGTLAPDMPRWQPVSVAGQQAFVSGHSVTWARLGFVYTVIADAPPQTIAQLVKALPDSGSPGVLGRLGRGFTRLAHVIDPFG